MHGPLHCAASGCDGCIDCETICVMCGKHYSCDDGCEPDGFCHPCAHVAAAKWKATDYALTVEHEKSTRYGAALRRIRYARDLKRAKTVASETLVKPKNLTLRDQEKP